MTAAADTLGEGRVVRLTDADVRVYEYGAVDGPPLLLLHGFLTSAFTWRHLTPRLAENHRVVLVDLPGSGRSPDPRTTGWDEQRGVTLIEELLDHLGIGQVTLVGSQMGGSLAAWFAALRPERVDRLVLMAAGVLGEEKANLSLYRLLAHPLLGSPAARMFPRRMFAARWRAAHGPGHAPDPDAVEHYYQQLRRRGPAMSRFGLGLRRGYGPHFDAIAEPIRGLDTPTLLLFGARDPLVPVSTGHRFDSLLASSRLVVLAECGDFPQEEQPGEVGRELLQFLGT